MGSNVATFDGGDPVATKRFTSREFNQETGRAKRAARSGPVYITDRGEPSHVLMSFDDYQRLAANEPGIIDALSHPSGVEDIELETLGARELARPADFE